jgi:hypothetical protein
MSLPTTGSESDFVHTMPSKVLSKRLYAVPTCYPSILLPLVSASEYLAWIIVSSTIPSPKAATKGFSFQGKKKNVSTKT